MAEREDEDLQMAIRMSLQGSPKRSKPIRAGAEEMEEPPEAKERRLQRELRAAAAERRIATMEMAKVEAGGFPSVCIPADGHGQGSALPVVLRSEEKVVNLGEELPSFVVEKLFLMLFGSDVSAGILSRWTNQGIRFSSDPETSIGLVQHEGGPCGVLAAIQAFILKFLLFCPKEIWNSNSTLVPETSRGEHSLPQACNQESVLFNSLCIAGKLAHITDDMKNRALVQSMVEMLFLCGKGERVVLATLNICRKHDADVSMSGLTDEVVSRALEGLMIESASDLRKILQVQKLSSKSDAFNCLMLELPVFRSRMGALLLLISALLSRGLDTIQEDRDDPNLPLVTAPFGHASQEIVNLLLCGQAVPNIFDGRMDLGGGMFLKGIPGSVEVGFLTLMESLNFCKVGQYLKCPKWPIWVVGSDSHYTVLFALDTSVQEENELDQRDLKIRRAFDAQDRSGGGGFISTDNFHKVLEEMGITLPSEKLNDLCSSGFVVWSEFWQALLDLDEEFGGLKNSVNSGRKQFDLYHFNGLAKSMSNENQSFGGETPVQTITPVQRPRLCRLGVVVPPSWSQEEFMADVATSGTDRDIENSTEVEVNQLPKPSQHAPLVDCIRTRWPRAICQWVGLPPSIV